MVIAAFALTFCGAISSGALFDEKGSPSRNLAAGTTSKATLTLADVDAATLDLEQLADMDVIVTSASKKEESLAGAPAAIYVITNEDIRRSGLSSVPELLRMVPGMTVQRLNSHAWTVSTRGFNGFPNEKMLVLIDGRAVYDPLFGGVNWDVQDVRLEDVDRIEVIRGPGGALWGANAVNGVVNVITRKAQQTQGPAFATSLGPSEGYRGSARYGGQIGKRFFYRVFAQSSYWDPSVTASDRDMFNDWNLTEGGMRSDWSLTPKDVLSLDAGTYRGAVRDTAAVADLTSDAIVNDAYRLTGGHLMGHWQHFFSGRSSTEVQAYCDWSDRTDIEFASEYRNTCNLQLQHNYQISARHSLIWGSDLRTTADQTRTTFRSHLNPPDRRLNLFSIFAQYEVAVIPQELRIVIGSKFERNTYTGLEMQPQVRAVWTPLRRHSIWGAVSRSVRIPTRNERDTFLTYSHLPPDGSGLPHLLAFEGNPGLRAEHQNAYELGYRYQFSRALFLDLAAFYNSYTQLIYPDLVHLVSYYAPNPPCLISAMSFTNFSTAQTHGLEVSAKWQPVHRWSLSAGITEDRGTGISMYATPRHLLTLQSRLSPGKEFSVDASLYHSNAISVKGPSRARISTSNRIDLGLSRPVVRGLSMGIWGRNLQSGHHLEGGGGFVSAGETPRAVVVQLEWQLHEESGSQ